MATKWNLHTEDWNRLSADARRQHAVIVASYGGDCDANGRAEFHRYSVAELCAHTIRQRLGARSQITLSTTTSVLELVGA